MSPRAPALLLPALLALAACNAKPLFRDTFTHGTANYVVEMEKRGAVTAAHGVLDINTEGGCTVWLKQELEGPVEISYTVTPIKAGGTWDRVSDVNCFWMATDPRSPGDFFAAHRTGKFSDYDELKTYYVGQGGNTNTSTRFRRYIGQRDIRPLLPQNDLHSPDVLLQPNVPLHIRLIADGPHIEYWCNNRRLFTLDDPAPYTRGHFGFRTTWSHLQIKNLRIISLAKKPAAKEHP
jgi:hypothetical protein